MQVEHRAFEPEAVLHVHHAIPAEQSGSKQKPTFRASFGTWFKRGNEESRLTKSFVIPMTKKPPRRPPCRASFSREARGEGGSRAVIVDFSQSQNYDSMTVRKLR